MIEIFFYTIATVFLLFFLGYGLAWLLIPDKLRTWVFWLSPWLSIVFIISTLVLLGLFGLAVKYTSWLVVMILLFLNGFVFLKKGKKIVPVSKNDLWLILFIIASVVFNLYPLVKTEGFATTISLGNNDIHAYAKTADYFVNHSIAEGLRDRVGLGIGTLVQFGYRWGASILTSFFLNIFQLRGFQYLYIFQVTLFGLVLPLVYLLTKILSKNGQSASLGAFLSMFLVGFNVNLLYMLYHNFLGQIIFTGLAILLIIFFISYFYSEAIFDKQLNQYDYCIGLVITVLYFSYHEGIILILFPIGVYCLLRFILFHKSISDYLRALTKIAMLVFLAASYLVVHAVNFLLFYRVNEFTEPIGWQVFRQRIPYANPFEMMGFYSLHSFPPLPLPAAWVLSLMTVLVMMFGFFRIKHKLLIISFVSVYILLLIFVLSRQQFWLFNRIVTSSIPLLTLLFSLGLAGFFAKNNPVINIFLIFLIDLVIVLSLFSASRLNVRLIKDHLAVDKSLISLQTLANNQLINEPIYTERLLNASLPWWRDLWADYFLSPKKNIVTDFDDRPKTSVLENNLLLLPKYPTDHAGPRVLFKNVGWENNYYILGRPCVTDRCLLSRPEDLSRITFGKNNYEDSLLISGWSVNESSQRWSNAKKAVLRLIIKNNQATRLQTKILTLKQPQQMSVYLNNQLLGKENLSTVWQTHSFNLKQPKPGVYQVKFIFSDLYQPSKLNINQDDRTLSANFQSISIE